MYSVMSNLNTIGIIDMKKHEKKDVALVGPQRSGKTLLLSRFCESSYEIVRTRGVNVKSITDSFQHAETDYTLEVALWDTEGRQHYVSAVKDYISKKDLYVIVVDINAPAETSIAYLESVLDTEILNATNTILVANDTREDQEDIDAVLSDDELDAISVNLFGEQVSKFKCSALHNKGVDVIKEALLEKLKATFIVEAVASDSDEESAGAGAGRHLLFKDESEGKGKEPAGMFQGCHMPVCNIM